MCAGSVPYTPNSVCGSMYRPIPMPIEAPGRQLALVAADGTRRSRSWLRPARASPPATRRTTRSPVGIVYGRSSRCRTLRRRSSSGSMPMARARLSTTCSRAYVSICHGPRYGARVHVLVYADFDVTASFGTAVGAGEERSGGHHPALGHQGIGADVVEMVDGHAEDLPVVVGRHRDRAPVGPRRRGGDEVLAPVLDPFHRTAEVVARQDARPARRESGTPSARIHRRRHPSRTRMRLSGTPVMRLVTVRTSCGDWVETHTLEPAGPWVPPRDDAPGLHRDSEIAVLDERLGHDVRRAVEQLAELVVDGQQGLPGDVAVPLAGVHELRGGRARSRSRRPAYPVRRRARSSRRRPRQSALVLASTST